jgi:hypothetical protein
MLRGTPGCRRINPSHSRVSTIWWTEGGADAEVSLQVGLGGRPAEHASISIDEGQILTLVRRESRHRGGRRHRWALGRRSRFGKWVHGRS